MYSKINLSDIKGYEAASKAKVASRIACLELKKAKKINLLNEFSNQLRVQVATGEQALWTDALQAHLGRLVTTDDFKDCQMKFTADHPDQYTLAHNGIDLGIVKRELKMDQDYLSMVENNYRISYEISFLPVRWVMQKPN
jgi:uncharacterized coiled-coil protein SlyX